jgi:hypothetical protein
MPPAARAGAGAHSNKAAPSGSSGRDKYDMGVGRIFLRACSAGSHRRPPMEGGDGRPDTVCPLTGPDN